KNIYKGIDVIYYGGKENGLKYDIVVNPGANPNDIKLKYTGAKLKLEGQKLIVQSELGETVETLPKVYQNINGKIVDVGCEYKLVNSEKPIGNREKTPTPIGYSLLANSSSLLANHYIVTFELTTYNHELPLIIDPYWATYYGGSKWEYPVDIDTDPTGNVLVGGHTESTDFPVGAGGISVVFQGVFGGSQNDPFFIKFDPSGSRIWATYYGGAGFENADDIDCDNAGNIVMTGVTNSINFPIGASGTNVVWQGPNAGSNEVFVIKLDPNGFRLWATYYGGTGVDGGNGVVCDNSGNVFVTGQGDSGFPVGSTGPNLVWQAVNGGYSDVFIIKFDPSGSRLWATFYGGSRGDQGSGISCDNAGNVLITGTAGSSNFPTGASGPNMVWQPALAGTKADLFVAKFDPIGSRLWATFYGGTDVDQGWGVSCDNAGNVLIIGYTVSTNFPVGAAGTNMVWQGGYGGGYSDLFVMKFDPFGSRLWATYYGGTFEETAGLNSITVDSKNNIYVLMEYEDKPGPVLNPCAYQPDFNTGNFGGTPEDVMIVKFNPNGKKICDTYFGGGGEDDLDGCGGICISSNTIYLTGQTTGAFPVTSGAFQATHGGGFDAFVATLCTNICEAKTLALNYSATVQSVCTNAPVKFTPSVNNACDTTGYKFHWIFTGGTPAVSDSVSPTVKFSGAGSHDVKLVVTTLCKKDSLTKINYITVNPCGGCTLNAQYTKGTANCSNCGCKEWIMVNATGGTSPYTYTWPDGYDKRYKNALCPGIYNVIVTDNNGCKTTVKVNAP
ncbi:MAG: hypothetical protein IT235_07920, partial [Bacteroidia bacterium]|nr:hypothetical protein [Bacteroidia bacterium]